MEASVRARKSYGAADRYLLIPFDQLSPQFPICSKHIPRARKLPTRARTIEHQIPLNRAICRFVVPYPRVVTRLRITSRPLINSSLLISGAIMRRAFWATGLACAMGVVFSLGQTVSAGSNFSFDFVAAEPSSYDHATGGGSF